MTEELETMSGEVSQVARKDGKLTGIKLRGREDAWLNWSQYPKGPMDAPEQGMSVKLGVSRGKNDSWWIGSCEIQSSENGAQPSEARAPSGSRAASIIRQTCIKAAAEIVAGFASRGWYQETESADVIQSVAVDVQAIAQELEQWVTRD